MQKHSKSYNRKHFGFNKHEREKKPQAESKRAATAVHNGSRTHQEAKPPNQPLGTYTPPLFQNGGHARPTFQSSHNNYR